MNTLIGEYFINHSLQNYSLAGNPEEAFRKCCMAGIMASVITMNVERSSVNETNSNEVDKGGQQPTNV